MEYRYCSSLQDPFDKFAANFNVSYLGREGLADLYKTFNLGSFDPNRVDIDKLNQDKVNFEIDVLKKVLPSHDGSALSVEYVFIDNIKSEKFIHTYTSLRADGKDKIRMCSSGVSTYVPRLNALFQFTFADNEEDYLKSSEIFNDVIASVRFL